MASATLLGFTILAVLSSTYSLEVKECGTLPQGLRASSAYYRDGGSIYIFGGMTKQTVEDEEVNVMSTQILRYDIATNTTEVVEAQLTKGLAHGAMTVDARGGTIYYVGGGDVYENTYESEVFRIRNLGNTPPFEMTSMGHLNTGLAGATAHFVNDEHLYVFGGQVDGTVTVFNTVTGLPTDLDTTLPYNVIYAPGLSFNNNYYIFGGLNQTANPGQSVHSREVIEYNFDDDTSAIFGPQLTQGVDSAAVVSKGNLAYFIGGYIGGDYAEQGFLEFNMDTKAVADICVEDEYKILPHSASAVYVEDTDTIYIFGGVTLQGDLETRILCIPLNTITDREPCPVENEDGGAGTKQLSVAVVIFGLVGYIRGFF